MITAGLCANVINDFPHVDDKRDYYFYPHFTDKAMIMAVYSVAPVDGRQKFIHKTVKYDKASMSRHDKDCLFLKETGRYIYELHYTQTAHSVLHRFYIPAQYMYLFFSESFSSSPMSIAIDEGMEALRVMKSRGIILPCTLLDSDLRATRTYVKGLDKR